MSSWLLAQVVVEQLLEAGVRDVVLSPGSRSAALAIALRRADERWELRLHVRIDERSAGFIALGIAKVDGRPVAIATTSGTAVGNLMPAVMEANHAGVPLVVLSADRPVSMINSGANQTTDQAGLFGAQVRAAARLASSNGEPDGWRFQLRRALALAAGTRTRNPGPVQVNLAFDVPLLPTDEKPSPAQPLAVTPAVSGTSRLELPVGPRTVVLAGDASVALGQQARLLAQAANLPLLAEPSSNARSGDRAIATYRLLLDKADLGGRIERVIVFGRPTLSRPVGRLLARRDVEVVLVADQATWVDPGFSARAVVDAVDLAPGDPHWTNQWLTGDQTLQIKIEMARREIDEGGRLDGGRLAELVVDRVGDGALVLGSSNPIRDADLAAIGAGAPRVYANRGLAGIDGTISTAIGVHLGLGEPVTALMGDLTFLHDVGGLWLGRLERPPLVRIVVASDAGGSIFHTLEQGGPEHADDFERVFGTPHDVDPAQVAVAYGWQVAQVTDTSELASRLLVPVQGPEALVVPISRDDRRAWAERLASL